jgi:hypothetical protein
MSDADKRETRQRALTIGACAAVFAFGGPLVAQRFGAQKAQETYITNAAVLAESLIEEERYAEATTSGVQLGIFSNSADPDALAHTASYIGGASASAGGLTCAPATVLRCKAWSTSPSTISACMAETTPNSIACRKPSIMRPARKTRSDRSRSPKWS